MKQHKLKLFSKSPFDKHEVSDNSLILVDENNQPVACLYSAYEWLKEGDIINETDLEFEHVNKRSKHLVIGDTVTFGYFEGEISEIIEDRKDEWNDKFRLVNCRNPSVSFKELKCEQTNTVARKDTESKRWMSAKVRCPHCKNF